MGPRFVATRVSGRTRLRRRRGSVELGAGRRGRAKHHYDRSHDHYDGSHDHDNNSTDHNIGTADDDDRGRSLDDHYATGRACHDDLERR